MTSMRECVSCTVSRHPDQLVIELALRAMAYDLGFDEEAVFLEVLLFLTGITDLHRSSDPRTWLENKPTLLPAFSDNRLLRSLTGLHASTGEITRDRCADNGEVTGVITD
jgi:hypothetical protein